VLATGIREQSLSKRSCDSLPLEACYCNNLAFMSTDTYHQLAASCLLQKLAQELGKQGIAVSAGFHR
jgi:hypothetical protein